MAANNLSGKAALLIGATTGIGRATARAFAAAGANVAFAGLGPEEGRSLEAQLKDEFSVDALFMEVDVRRDAEVREFTRQAVQRFGRIHAAVNNAGTEGRFAPLHETTAEDFERLIGVNLRGVWLGMREQIPHMLSHGGGAIVNTASMAGINGIANVALYTASKHAVVGLTKAAALELAKSNVRVNAVAPGPVDTGLLHRMVAGHIDIATIAAGVPMGRVSQPEEIASAILWLCTDAASYVTGHTLAIDGGSTVA